MRRSPASRFKLGRSATLCVVLVAMVLPASAGATALMISEPGTHGTDHGYRGYDTARYMGAQYEREIVEVKSSWSGINWAGIADPFVDGAIANGLAPFLTLTASPDPASWPSGGRVPAVGTFAAVCSEMAQRYNGKVMHYSVWNEPNLVHVGNLGPSTYTALYNACRGAIKAVSPSANVYFGEFSTASSGWGGLNACQYFRSATPVGSNIVTEGVAIHPYQFAIPPSEQLGTECRGIGRLSNWQSDLASAKNLNALKTAGGGTAPLLISEFGYCAARTPAFPSKPYTSSSGQAACPNNSSGPANVKDEVTRATWIAQAFNWAKTHNVLIFNQHTLFKRNRRLCLQPGWLSLGERDCRLHKWNVDALCRGS